MHITDKHEEIVNKLSKQIVYFYDNNIPFRIYRGGTNSTRIISFEKDKLLDIRKLNKVISVNIKNKTAIVEPNVPMDKLVRETLKYGLVPQVVMEFPGITVAGGIQGGAGESSSFKYGIFNSIANWYELILADGSIIKASNDVNSDLFWSCAGSYGTLGVMTAIEINLILAKKYVQLEYIPVCGYADAIKLISDEIKKVPDYIDGILFSKDNGVVMIGKMTNSLDYPKQTFRKATDDWFFSHVEKMQNRNIEIIPIVDYLFRYDRGGFWTGKLCFEMFNTPFNKSTRWLLNPLMKVRKMYSALQASGVSQQWIIQDVCMPIEKSVEFLQYIEDKFSIFPLWLCPLKPDKKSVFIPTNLQTKMVMNVGVWGRFDGDYGELVKANRDFEKKIYDLNGKKVLYAQAFYNEDIFWQIYGGKQEYDKIRAKYKATYLPTIYDKVIVSEKHKVSSKRGVLFALLGLDGIKIK